VVVCAWGVEHSGMHCIGNSAVEWVFVWLLWCAGVSLVQILMVAGDEGSTERNVAVGAARSVERNSGLVLKLRFAEDPCNKACVGSAECPNSHNLKPGLYRACWGAHVTL